MSLKKFLLSKIFLKNLAIAFSIIVGLLIIFLLWLNIYTRHGQARPVPDFRGLTIEQAATLAKKHKLRYQIIDSVYTNTVPKGCIAEQSPKPGYKVKKGRRIVLTINAFNPEMVEVPDLVGLPKRQALAVLQTAGLEPGQLYYVPDLSVDVVLKQLHNGRELHKGDSIQKGAVIDLVLGKGLSNERTPVPNLIGLNYEQARRTVLGASLNIGAYIYDNTVTSKEDSISAFVFKQNPEYKENVTLQLGSAVYIWLTTDSSKLPVDSTLFSISDTLGISFLQ
ncbi:MAG TPA: PASTA domain-containing protein [Bacteroidales bacterium]|nr:PASTA domain-containing protein [Bacteroidales bacterium]HCI56471.1 penicillin-binding protein [Bacteroidales bacterium]HOU95574.1 PASTA domain-containing protein [Bacteroidales bacterium]HQG36197.1 PASTA domain-containing protein [Bacteroidales bacterium]HQG53472.1 PASTA domain-containing protein [Bacteroidales bacterium]